MNRLAMLRVAWWTILVQILCAFLFLARLHSRPLRYSEHNRIEQKQRVYFRLKVTAYCSCRKCCGKWAKFGLTASGTRPIRRRTVATDTSVIPHGSVLRIPSVGIVVSKDTGSKIVDGHVDLYMGDARYHSEARQWGVQYLDVEVISKGTNDKGTAAREAGKRSRRSRQRTSASP